MFRCSEGIDLEHRLASISLPTLVLHGRLDVIAPLTSAEKLAALIPGTKLVIADDAGHVPTMTRPQWVSEQINEFFKGR